MNAMTESLTQNTDGLKPDLDFHLHGVQYPSNGEWPTTFDNFNSLLEQFPWATIIRD